MAEQKVEAPKKKTLPRKNLVVPKVSKATTNYAYYSACADEVPGRSSSNTDCMGSCFGHMSSYKGQKREYNVRLFVLKSHGLSEKDVQHWVMFINRCGFKCKYEKVGEQDTMIFMGKDYLNWSHQKLAVTAARYICMHYNTGYNEIAHLATTLYEKYPNLDAYQAFILAHYAQSAGSYFDSGHAVVNFGNGAPQLITKDQLVERIKARPNDSINTSCTSYIGGVTMRDGMIALAKKGEWEKVIENLI